jgi:hypothetical protein
MAKEKNPQKNAIFETMEVVKSINRNNKFSLFNFLFIKKFRNLIFNEDNI